MQPGQPTEPLFEIDDEVGNFIVLAVDPVTLTHATARALNKTMWPGATARLLEEDDDPVRAVARFFGARAIHIMQAMGGADIQTSTNDSIRRNWLDYILTKDNARWPGRPELGIRIVSALVASCDFYGVTLETIA